MIYKYQAYNRIIESEIPLPLQPMSAEEVNNKSNAPDQHYLLQTGNITLRRGEIESNITYTHKLDFFHYTFSHNTITIDIPNIAVFNIEDSTHVTYDPHPYPGNTEKKIGLLFLHLILQFLITGSSHIQFLFHGSAVALPGDGALGDGGALILIGEKGAGKSTLAAALSLSGCSLLCDDIVPIVTAEDIAPAVLPGIARAKLLPDAYQRLCGDPETASRHFDGISKYYTDLPLTNETLPLTAMIYLEQKAVKTVKTAPLRGALKFQKMIRQVIRIDGLDTAERLFETVTGTCRDIPLYQVTFPENADPWVLVNTLAVALQLLETGVRRREP